MKKILLSLGTIVSIGLPIAAVVSCGSTEEQKEMNLDKTLLEKLNNSVAFGIESGTYLDDLITRNGITTGLVDLSFVITKEVVLGEVLFDANEPLNIMYYLTPDEEGIIQKKLSINGHVMNETEKPIANIVNSLNETIVAKHRL